MFEKYRKIEKNIPRKSFNSVYLIKCFETYTKITSQNIKIASNLAHHKI